MDKWNEITDDLQEFYDYVKPRLESLKEKAFCQNEMYTFKDFFEDFANEFNEILDDPREES
jgi:site-specific DNA-adenine methylase